MSTESLFRNCPLCGAGMMPRAVVCVSCGQRVDQSAAPVAPAPVAPAPGGYALEDRGNPYRTPQPHDIYAAHAAPPTLVYSDLTKDAAAKAEGFATEAESVLPIIVVSCLIGPLWLIMMPYYGWRLIAWQKLNNQYNELKFANPASPFGHIAVKFQAAWSQLLVGFVSGAVIWGLGMLMFILTIIGIIADVA